MRCYVYILECADKTLYTGFTNDLERRVAEHNASKKGARYTRARRPVILKYSERLNSESRAKKREYAIKSLSREAKMLLIERKKAKVKS